MRAAVLLAAGLALAGPAGAQESWSYVTGQELHESCAMEPPVAGMTHHPLCLSYVLGAIDGMKAAHAGLLPCLGMAVNGEQAVDVVKKYLADNPKIRHFDAALLVFVAVYDAFGCGIEP